jgi:hypothetical protein
LGPVRGGVPEEAKRDAGELTPSLWVIL